VGAFLWHHHHVAPQQAGGILATGLVN